MTETNMTTESVLQFVGKVGDTPKLQHRVDGLNGDLGGLRKLATEAGYEFTPQEWLATVSELRDGGELSGDALQGVVGGMSGAGASYSPTIGDVQARFACFPPIGTRIDVTSGR